MRTDGSIVNIYPFNFAQNGFCFDYLIAGGHIKYCTCKTTWTGRFSVRCSVNPTAGREQL